MYKAELKAALNKSLNEFYLEERGNRITTNNMDGFGLKIGKVLDENEVREMKKDESTTSE